MFPGAWYEKGAGPSCKQMNGLVRMLLGPDAWKLESLTIANEDLILSHAPSLAANRDEEMSTTFEFSYGITGVALLQVPVAGPSNSFSYLAARARVDTEKLQ